MAMHGKDWIKDQYRYWPDEKIFKTIQCSTNIKDINNLSDTSIFIHDMIMR